MNGEKHRRKPPAPLEGSDLERHFAAVQNILWNQFQLSVGHAPSLAGDAREFFVKDFLSTHIPPRLRIGSGQILVDGDRTGQTDVVVYRDDALALPLGGSSLFYADGVAAAIEVKSTLECADFTGQIARNFQQLSSLEKPPLRVVFALRLHGNGQRRRVVAEWARTKDLAPSQLPDLVILLDNAPIVRGGALECLCGNSFAGLSPQKLYKFGDYQDQKWLGLMLLVFELLARSHVGLVPQWNKDLQAILQPITPVILADERATG